MTIYATFGYFITHMYLTETHANVTVNPQSGNGFEYWFLLSFQILKGNLNKICYYVDMITEGSNSDTRLQNNVVHLNINIVHW